MKVLVYGLLLANITITAGCTVISVADALVSTAVDVTVGTVKVAVKVTSAVIDTAIPDDDEEN
jgi:hypothetical protein